MADNKKTEKNSILKQITGNKLNFALTIAIAVVLVVIVILFSIIIKRKIDNKNEENKTVTTKETSLPGSDDKDVDEEKPDYSEWVMSWDNRLLIESFLESICENRDVVNDGDNSIEDIRGKIKDDLLHIADESGVFWNCEYEKYDEYDNGSYIESRFLIKGGLDAYKSFAEMLGINLDVNSLPVVSSGVHVDTGLYYNEENNELVRAYAEDEECYSETEAIMDACFYDKDENEMIAYASFVCEGEYMYSAACHFVPDDGTFGIKINSISKLYMNRSCTVPYPDSELSTADILMWNAFCGDYGKVSERYNPSSYLPYFGINVKRDDGSVSAPEEFVYLDEYMDEYTDEYYSWVRDAIFLDFDNDGEIEVLAGRNSVGGYGGVCFDFRDDGMYVLAQGDGTAMYLTYSWYDNAIWLSYEDVTHAGRETHYLTKFGKDGKVEDTIELQAEATDEKYENYRYTLNGKEITKEEFEKYGREILSDGRIEIEEYVSDVVAEPVVDESYKAAYRNKVMEFQSAREQNQSEWSTLNYGLIYFDDDDIPELVCGLDGYDVSMYTYRNGNLVTIMDNWPYGAFGNAGYEYYPRKAIVSNSNSDYAGAVVYVTYMTYNAESNDFDGPSLDYKMCYFLDINGDGEVDWIDIDNSEDSLDEPIYYYGDTIVNEYQIADMVNEFTQGEECEGVNGDMSYDEILNALN